jgi:hypothetical protein
VHINRASVGKNAGGAIHVVRRAELRIRYARITAGDAVAATRPCPAYRVADGDVYRLRSKLERSVRRDSHVNDLAGHSWSGALDWLPVLIDDYYSAVRTDSWTFICKRRGRK